MASAGRVHDRSILDALENIVPVSFDAPVWRITRAGHDAIRGSVANGRWSPGGNTEILYLSLERGGALAEIGFRLALEPIWPSQLKHEIHQVTTRTERTLRLSDVASLVPFGIEVSKYESFDYGNTRALAAAAHFLEFDGMIVPSARHKSLNLVIFMDRGSSTALELVKSEPVDWTQWRTNVRKPKAT